MSVTIINYGVNTVALDSCEFHDFHCGNKCHMWRNKKKSNLIFIKFRDWFNSFLIQTALQAHS